MNLRMPEMDLGIGYFTWTLHGLSPSDFMQALRVNGIIPLFYS